MKTCSLIYLCRTTMLVDVNIVHDVDIANVPGVTAKHGCFSQVMPVFLSVKHSLAMRTQISCRKRKQAKTTNMADIESFDGIGCCGILLENAVISILAACCLATSR
jgi:hypothetical protein